MSEQIILPRQSQLLPSSDAKETALQAVLQGGVNKVLWDECQLIWDSRSLIDDTATSEDQMAVFGVKGKVGTQQGQILAFQIRYAVRFEPEPLYLVYAAINGARHRHDFNKEEFEVVQSELPEGVNASDFVNEAVGFLTAKVGSIGPQAVIKSFLAPRNGVDQDETQTNGL
ncbi:hypothetical protein E5D57_012470 [Metarhizium anisopliae]|nr:hypothetical protein E5D57_012470 [Metarhizium anisopliae]